MEIRIDDDKRICDIQREFNEQFPFLKLEFFELNAITKQIFSKHNLIVDTERKIDKIRQFRTKDHIDIKGNQKVNKLEKDFLDYFGIYVQVFRKSGNSWLLITPTTSSWSLSEQNKMGQEMSTIRREESADDYEKYREQP